MIKELLIAAGQQQQQQATGSNSGSAAIDAMRQGVTEVGGTGNEDLNSDIGNIINAVIGVVGIICVVVIILGGISYATSQGDPAKVKKGKDTILYGVIGLIVVLLSFAIVNFVLNAMAK